ncbi:MULTISPECIES: RDD family protein [Pseudoalteromonas]|uniref:RDD family protein n=1 Tax=Pseudoalteromonas TaxID=53246 RepID=UPI0002F41B99|nr:MULTISPECIES: RDD family protein [Pseudoalteromonas]MDP4489326.1 RDD family protein [Pseudoalteromonas piscicida]
MFEVPPFSEYSYEELLEVKKHIDRDKYPERYETVVTLLNDKFNGHNRQGETSTEAYIKPCKYATFWPRVGAILIDGLILSIVIYIECLIFGFNYHGSNLLLTTVGCIQMSLYNLFMHGCYGQTLGKMITRIKVVDHDTEQKISIKQSLRRESVELVLYMLFLALVMALSVVLLINNTVPPVMLHLLSGIEAVLLCWFLAELGSVILNDKSRSLHDYIGKTVVVRVD